mgnify:CR=1 FL=1
MSRSVKAAQYERTSRLRRTYDVQANMLGWTKLDVLAAYTTDDDDLIVFDKDERRLSGAALPLSAETENVAAHVIVTPADVPAAEFGPRWQAMRAKISYALQDDVGALDLSTADRAKALENMELLAASLLRAVQVLREHDGPDWREAIGL